MQNALQQLHAKRRSRSLQQIIFIVLLLVAFGLLGWIGLHTQHEWDLSRGQKNSLTPTSIDLLNKLEGEIEFMAFMSKNPGARENIRELIGQYQKHNKKIQLEFIDPNLRPDLTRKYGIKRDGEVRISVKNPAIANGKAQTELLREISETAISNALLRLNRSSERIIVFVNGHGERNPFGQANHDIRQFANELADKGYDLQNLDVTQGSDIPENARMLVIASPQLDYLPQEVERITQYVVQGGNLLWLSDPDGLKGLDTLLTTLGLSSPSGTVIDQGTQELGIADASFSIISNYNSHPALQNFNVVALFPQARIFEPLAQDSVWAQSPFLVTAERTWLETDTLQDSVSFDPELDTQGPLNIGYSLVRDIENGDEDKIRQQRILLIGDGDFISSRFLHNGANLPLGLNLIDWLSGEENFLNLRFNETQDVSLNLDDKTLGWIGLFFLIVLPGLCFLIAIRIWSKRRNS